MNRDDIIHMAREAGWPDSLIAPVIMAKLTEFAALVAAAEREECAKVCDSVGDAEGHVYNAADYIRARGNT